MVSVVELVDTPDCGSGAAALRVQVSSLTPNGRMAEWFMALSWKGSEGNTSASSNLVSSSISIPKILLLVQFYVFYKLKLYL